MLVDGRKNIFHGYGALEFEGGRKYVGEFKDGMPAYEFGDSENIIDDQWKHFTLNSDVGTYTGHTEAFIPNGYGVFTYSSGTVLIDEGYFKDGRLDGQGTSTTTGGKFIGRFKEGKLHGYTVVDVVDDAVAVIRHR